MSYVYVQPYDKKKGRYTGFSCWVYKNYGKERCTSHAIGWKTLNQLVLEDIRRNAMEARVCTSDYMDDFDASVSWANWSDDPKIRELALNKDTFELSSARHIPIYKCNTLEELNEFKTTFSGTFTMDGTRDEVPSFEEVTADYTEDFFIENTLLLVYVEANSCTPRFGVDSVSKENGTLSVHVKYTYTPEEGDSAMAG